MNEPHDLTSLLGADGKVDPDLVRAASSCGDGDDSDDGALSVTFRLTRDLQKRLDKYLQDRIPFMSRTQLQRLIKEKAVEVNGRCPKASTVLRLDDEVVVTVPPPPTKEIQPDDIPLTVLYEDEHLIVLNKQAGIVVHPARSHKTGTIVNALAWHFLHNSDGTLSSVGKDEARPGVVHRLDKDTTGVLIAAKSDVAHYRLGKQFHDRTVEKRYLAVVTGTVEPPADILDFPIGKHTVIRELMTVRYDDASKPARTTYRLKQQFDGYALVELDLHTGRTHQIRVHMAHMGWPLVGDDMYDGPLLDLSHLTDTISSGDPQDAPVMHRQALHAASIEFDHPISALRMRLEAPLPDDMCRLLDLLGQYRATD
ncbi:MAG: RluA family pseudouridine synthase [Planctomycetes bacterium]|nr:RluA family pseudouridine synthase [Planctomycetota bacterium]